MVRIMQNNNPSTVAYNVTEVDSPMIKLEIESNTFKNKQQEREKRVRERLEGYYISPLIYLFLIYCRPLYIGEIIMIIIKLGKLIFYFIEIKFSKYYDLYCLILFRLQMIN